MTTIRVFCEECNSEFLLDYVDAETEPQHCPFCASDLDEDFITEINSEKEWDDDLFEWQEEWRKDDELSKE